MLLTQSACLLLPAQVCLENKEGAQRVGPSYWICVGSDSVGAAQSRSSAGLQLLVRLGLTIATYRPHILDPNKRH